MELDHNDLLFLRIANDPLIRQDLLELLQALGLLFAFLEAKSGTTQ